MTKEEYNKKVEEENKRHENALESIIAEYAESNNPVKIGDYITDHYQTIRVEEMHPYFDSWRNEPCMIYTGKTCKKDGSPMKRPQESKSYQMNLMMVNGKSIK